LIDASGPKVSQRLKTHALEPYNIRSRRTGTLRNIIKITGGAYHTLFVNSSGELYTFGCNNCGQLGLGDALSHFQIDKVEHCLLEDGSLTTLPPIVDIAAGESHSLILSADGRVFTFGSNSNSQLGYSGVWHVDPTQVHAIRKSKWDSPSTATTSSSATASPEKHSASVHVAHAAVSHTAVAASLLQVDSDSVESRFQPLPRQLSAEKFKCSSNSLSSSSLSTSSSQGQAGRVLQVAAQSRFSGCCNADGKLFTWGTGHSLQLGNEEPADEEEPYQVDLKTRTCFSVRCGGQFTMFLLDPKDSGPASAAPQARSATEGDNQKTGAEALVKHAMKYRPHFEIPPSSPVHSAAVHQNANFQSPAPFFSAPPSSPAVGVALSGMMSVAIDSHMTVTTGLEGEQLRRIDVLVSQRTHNESPSRVLGPEFNKMLVSPQKKTKTDDGATDASMDERSAPWSPVKYAFRQSRRGQLIFVH
jgi:hypothetical protein